MKRKKRRRGLAGTPAEHEQQARYYMDAAGSALKHARGTCDLPALVGAAKLAEAAVAEASWTTGGTQRKAELLQEVVDGEVGRFQSRCLR